MAHEEIGGNGTPPEEWSGERTDVSIDIGGKSQRMRPPDVSTNACTHIYSLGCGW